MPMDSAKTPINWINYDFDDGLGNPISQSGKGFRQLSKYSKGFEDLPMEAALGPSDISVSKNGDNKIIWISTAGPVIYSNDGGNVWNVLEDSIRLNLDGVQIRVDKNGTIWMGNNGRLARSSNEGATWEIVIDSSSGADTIEIRENTVWVGNFQGEILTVSISTLNVVKKGSIGKPVTAILPASDGKLYAGNFDGLHVSTNSGQTFSPFAPEIFAGKPV